MQEKQGGEETDLYHFYERAEVHIASSIGCPWPCRVGISGDLSREDELRFCSEQTYALSATSSISRS